MRKISKKRIRRFFLKIIVLTIVILLGINTFLWLASSEEERALQKLNYSVEAIDLIFENKLDEYLIDNNIYSKTLEVALITNQYKDNLLEEYVHLPYKNYNNYINQINSLYKIGYQRSAVEAIFNNLLEEDIAIIINKNTVIADIASYIKDKYFNIDNLNRYISYKDKHQAYEHNKVISYVNMYLDYPHYSHNIDIDNPDDLLVLVNKYYKLSKDFAPKDLVKIDKKYIDEYDRYVIPVVKENFEQMASDMKKLGLTIVVNSAYRSYQSQLDTYNGYVKGRGQAYADSIAARPGHSEHQTGLAIDVKDVTDNYSEFEKSDEYKWMKDNAHKYGFILRFPKDKTHITGYNFEAWHYRYVGKDIAKYIYENDLTLDEYYAMFIANKKD